MCCAAFLRPLAYSTLADLVHHVRGDLTFPQLLRVVQLFARNIHDATLPFNIQTMSAKLLLNLVEVIARKSTDMEGKKSILTCTDYNNGRLISTFWFFLFAAGRALLVRILDNFVNRFSSLKRSIPAILSQSIESDDTKSGTLQHQKRKRFQARNLTAVKGSFALRYLQCFLLGSHFFNRISKSQTAVF